MCFDSCREPRYTIHVIFLDQSKPDLEQPTGILTLAAMNSILETMCNYVDSFLPNDKMLIKSLLAIDKSQVSEVKP